TFYYAYCNYLFTLVYYFIENKGSDFVHFFEDFEITGNTHIITGENARHIEKSLRMKKGESITLCTPSGTKCKCVIEKIDNKCVYLNIISKEMCDSEPNVFVTLYQALPKGDKMEMIIQKSVELGVSEIVPVISKRCVSRPDRKSLEKKTLRWQKIALQASMQSGRGIIPKVRECEDFEKAVKNAFGRKILFYENGGEPLRKIIDNTSERISIFIGSEGGFAGDEVEFFLKNEGLTATLGKRILRAETAPLCALSLIMYQTGNME
ncbi:MAG: RsmE family RNA methyltransferase, partial [Acutalibacteraceae bacterium]